MKFITLTAAAAVGLLSAPAFANLDLAKKNNCLACHSVDAKIVGPAYKDVATKYAKDKDAVKKITESIKKGGSGKWGPAPMPAQAQLSDADAEKLAKWIAGGAK